MSVLSIDVPHHILLTLGSDSVVYGIVQCESCPVSTIDTDAWIYGFDKDVLDTSPRGDVDVIIDGCCKDRDVLCLISALVSYGFTQAPSSGLALCVVVCKSCNSRCAFCNHVMLSPYRPKHYSTNLKIMVPNWPGPETVNLSVFIDQDTNSTIF